MSRLFGSVYLDEDVDVLVGELLQAKGVDALTARDAGMLQESDDSQLEFAARNRRAIVTHDYVDYLNLHRRYLDMGISALRYHTGEQVPRISVSDSE